VIKNKAMKVLITQHQYNYFMLYEATLEMDRYYYNLADDFYDKMIIELEKKNYVYQNGDIIFAADKIEDDYYDLLILFTSKGKNITQFEEEAKSDYYIGSYRNYRVIVINNLKEDRNPSKGIIRKSFIHEFIHYLDYKRSKYKGGISKLKSLEKYYNDPLEFNAYYQESATYLAKMFEDEKIRSLHLKIFDTFDKFYKWALDKVFNKDFIKYLNETNRRKLINRLYNIYSHYLIEK